VTAPRVSQGSSGSYVNEWSKDELCKIAETDDLHVEPAARMVGRSGRRRGFDHSPSLALSMCAPRQEAFFVSIDAISLAICGKRCICKPAIEVSKHSFIIEPKDERLHPLTRRIPNFLWDC